MRNGGPALSQSSQSAQASTQAARSGAVACAAKRGSGAQAPAATRTRAIRALANITCPVGVDHGAGHARRCIERTESGNGGNLPGGGDAAERNIRQQRIAAAGCEVIAGGCRVGEARRYREAE